MRPISLASNKKRTHPMQDIKPNFNGKTLLSYQRLSNVLYRLGILSMYFLRIGHPILPTGYINTFSRFYNYRKRNLMHRKFSFIFFRECFSQTTEIVINIETSSVFPFVVSNVLRTNHILLFCNYRCSRRCWIEHTFI